MAGTLVIDTVKSSTSGPPTFQNTSGTEVGQLCDAWVNFNGTTSPGTVRASFNVGSVTKNATGDYTLNFTNALADANYATTVDAEASSGAGPYAVRGSATKTTTAFRFGTASGSTGTYTDLDQISVSVFR